MTVMVSNISYQTLVRAVELIKENWFIACNYFLCRKLDIMCCNKLPHCYNPFETSQIQIRVNEHAQCIYGMLKVHGTSMLSNYNGRVQVQEMH